MNNCGYFTLNLDTDSMCLAKDRSYPWTNKQTFYLTFIHMTNHGLSVDHLPTSSFPRSYWMTPLHLLPAWTTAIYILYTHIRIWKTDTFDPHIVPIFISCSLCHKGTFFQNLWKKLEKRGLNDMHSTYSWNIKWQKCARMDLNGFIFKKINKN